MGTMRPERFPVCQLLLLVLFRISTVLAQEPGDRQPLRLKVEVRSEATDREWRCKEGRAESGDYGYVEGLGYESKSGFGHNSCEIVHIRGGARFLTDDAIRASFDETAVLGAKRLAGPALTSFRSRVEAERDLYVRHAALGRAKNESLVIRLCARGNLLAGTGASKEVDFVYARVFAGSPESLARAQTRLREGAGLAGPPRKP